MNTYFSKDVKIVKVSSYDRFKLFDIEEDVRPEWKMFGHTILKRKTYYFGTNHVGKTTKYLDSIEAAYEEGLRQFSWLKESCYLLDEEEKCCYRKPYVVIELNNDEEIEKYFNSNFERDDYLKKLGVDEFVKY